MTRIPEIRVDVVVYGSISCFFFLTRETLLLFFLGVFIVLYHRNSWVVVVMGFSADYAVPPQWLVLCAAAHCVVLEFVDGVLRP